MRDGGCSAERSSLEVAMGVWEGLLLVLFQSL